ncbi:MAG: hypothetical protein EA405_09410 [Rhodospirillales bacterium]|nr:MAG: hypothetical protein EA405_09410 [Rhodospirillales bacterium]
MEFPPRIYMIGAQKAGTTTLADLLNQQPTIMLSSPKEPHFYSRHWGRGIGWYQKCFDPCDTCILVDASTSYSQAPTDLFPKAMDTKPNPYLCDVPERIHSLRPDAKFIYVLRNPADRAYSAYWHRVRRGEEHRPFRVAMREVTAYYRGSDYIGQLRNYTKIFDIENFHFIIFEKMKRDIGATVQSCCDFLEVDFDPTTTGLGVGVPAAEQHKNKSFQYNGFANAVAGLFPSRDSFEDFVGTAKRIVPKALRPYIGRVITADIPPMADDDYATIMEMYSTRIEQLSGMIDVDLGVWWSPSKATAVPAT